MATNDFLPFCPTDTGTNLLTEVEYTAAADRVSGNKPGIASAKLNNKALRQGTYIAACLAQFLSDSTGDDMLDDENESNVLATMAKAFNKVPNVQTFSSSGTYTPSAHVKWAEVIAIGGGGGSGSTSTNSSQGFPAGGGGGGGGVARKFINSPTSQTVTIGAAGAAGAIGAAGGDGGNTTFGAILTANGGKGGNCFDLGNSNGGVGGTATGGDSNLQGNPGGPGVAGVPGVQGGGGGHGGAAAGFGGAGRGTGVNGSGTAGTDFGGGGGSNEGGFSASAGNAGFHGAVIVIEHF